MRAVVAEYRRLAEGDGGPFTDDAFWQGATLAAEDAERAATEASEAAGLPAALALAPGVCQGLGGGIEASLAETRFNQWWHLLAVLVLNAGLAGEILLVRLLG
jgi:hypothetical protein